MVKVTINYEGDLRCIATHGPSSAKMSTDAPTDNHGKGESFSPTDLVATALGTCMLTVMAIKADQQGIDLRGATVQVEKSMAAAPVRKIAELAVKLTLPATIPAEARPLLEATAHTCPVKESLAADIAMPIVFDWSR